MDLLGFEMILNLEYASYWFPIYNKRVYAYFNHQNIPHF